MSPKNKGKFGKGKPSIEAEDEFVSGVNRVGQKLKPYVKQIGIAVAIVTVILVSLFTYRWWQNRKAVHATALYNEAIALAQRPVEPPAEPKENDPENAGETPDNPAAADDVDPTEPKPFESETARSEAVLAVLSRLHAEYGSTGIAKEAELLQAKTLLALGRHDEAITHYQSYVGNASNPELKAMALEGIALAHEAKAAAIEDAGARQAALEQALAAFKNIQPAEQGPHKDYALYHEARILIALDRRDEAQAALEKASEISDSPLANDIQDRLALLQGARAE